MEILVKIRKQIFWEFDAVHFNEFLQWTVFLVIEISTIFLIH